ncbi:MAG: MerR family transcriptional regulator [bacterium]|nr:MerR family transcriptional regulator [bacterium]
MASRRSRGRVEYLMISAVAERFDIHPQTLRLYEREGLINPKRSDGNTRLYDDETLRRLEIVLTLTREMGVNLAGVEVVLNMREQMDRMQNEMDRVLEYVRRQAAERRAGGTGVRRRHALVKVESGPLVKVEEE